MRDLVIFLLIIVVASQLLSSWFPGCKGAGNGNITSDAGGIKINNDKKDNNNSKKLPPSPISVSLNVVIKKSEYSVGSNNFSLDDVVKLIEDGKKSIDGYNVIIYHENANVLAHDKLVSKLHEMAVNYSLKENK